MIFGLGPKEHRLIVHPLGDSVSVHNGDQLLQTLKQHGYPISYSCEDGRCGLCRYELLQGEVVEADRPPWQFPGVPCDSKLACQTTLVDDCVIRLLEPNNTVTHPPRKAMKGLISQKWKLSDRIMAVRVRVPKSFSFSPGQFAKIHFGKNLARTYSMANAYNQGYLEFHVQRHPYGEASNLLWEKLDRGDEVRIDGPLGVSFLREYDDCPLLCVASESGLAPTLSILRGIARAGMRNPIHLYVGCLRYEDLYGAEELSQIIESLPAVEKVSWVVYSAPPEAEVRQSTLTAAIEEDFEDLHGYRAYVFGSSHAVENVVRSITRLGVPWERLHSDPFTPTGD